MWRISGERGVLCVYAATAFCRPKLAPPSEDLMFKPDTITVPFGNTVVWQKDEKSRPGYMV